MPKGLWAEDRAGTEIWW